jgi:hypothetical protein
VQAAAALEAEIGARSCRCHVHVVARPPVRPLMGVTVHHITHSGCEARVGASGGERAGCRRLFGGRFD